ncbi:hypothetical protein GCM10027048_37100 [Hymenobacter coalescens]
MRHDTAVFEQLRVIVAGFLRDFALHGFADFTLGHTVGSAFHGAVEQAKLRVAGYGQQAQQAAAKEKEFHDTKQNGAK